MSKSDTWFNYSLTVFILILFVDIKPERLNLKYLHTGYILGVLKINLLNLLDTYQHYIIYDYTIKN